MSTKLHVDVGSKWTSEAEVEGWRHFVVVSVRRTGQVELAASCDPQRRVVVEREALARRKGWSPGWLSTSPCASGERSAAGRVRGRTSSE